MKILVEFDLWFAPTRVGRCRVSLQLSHTNAPQGQVPDCLYLYYLLHHNSYPPQFADYLLLYIYIIWVTNMQICNAGPRSRLIYRMLCTSSDCDINITYLHTCIWVLWLFIYISDNFYTCLYDGPRTQIRGSSGNYWAFNPIFVDYHYHTKLLFNIQPLTA